MWGIGIGIGWVIEEREGERECERERERGCVSVVVLVPVRREESETERWWCLCVGGERVDPSGDMGVGGGLQVGEAGGWAGASID